MNLSAEAVALAAGIVWWEHSTIVMSGRGIEAAVQEVGIVAVGLEVDNEAVGVVFGIGEQEIGMWTEETAGIESGPAARVKALVVAVVHKNMVYLAEALRIGAV